MKLGFRRVTEDWCVWLQISVFTVPKYSFIEITQTYDEKSVVHFSCGATDWISNSLIEKYSEA